MLGFIIKKIIGSKNDAEVKKASPMGAKINEAEQSLQSQPDDALRQKTVEWKQRLTAIQDKTELTARLTRSCPRPSRS